MSWASLEKTLSQQSSLRDVARRVITRLRDDGRGNPLDVDPIGLAKSAQVTASQAIAILQLLAEAGLGRFVVHVLDPHGATVGRFASLADVPEEVEDDFGNSVQTQTANTRILFHLDPTQRVSIRVPRRAGLDAP